MQPRQNSRVKFIKILLTRQITQLYISCLRLIDPAQANPIGYPRMSRNGSGAIVMSVCPISRRAPLLYFRMCLEYFLTCDSIVIIHKHRHITRCLFSTN